MREQTPPFRTLIKPATLAAIGSLELRARMIVEGFTSGMHRSPYAGYSVEFAQHRAYTPGDDLRHLDWKVFGRSDRLVVKQYQQETNLDLHLLIDVSGSMAYGSLTHEPLAKNPSSSQASARASWRKVDVAATLAAAMALLALRQGDRAGLVLFDPQAIDKPLTQVTRLAGGDDHGRALLEVLSGFQTQPDTQPETQVDPKPDTGSARAPTRRSPTGSTEAPGSPGAPDLGRVIDQFLARTPRRGLVVLLSDLLDDPTALERALARLSHRGHDLMLIQILDHAERTFPFTDGARFFGLEGEGRLSVDPASLRTAYLEALDRQLAAVGTVARRFGFDHVLLDTAQPPGPVLAQFLAHRAARLARKGSS